MKILSALVAFTLIIGGMYFIFMGDFAFDIPGINARFAAAVPSALKSEMPYTGAPLTKEYKNSTYRFSVSMPEEFVAQELPPDDSGSHAILFQNQKGEGIQVYLTPNQGDIKVVTAADVRSSIPDMAVTDEEVVEIGNDYRGVAFKSDNDAFQGSSREVWFVFRGNLYQISTYARLDPLMKAMFATWKFY